MTKQEYIDKYGEDWYNDYKKRCKEYYLQNKEKCLERNKKYIISHKKEVDEKNKKWRNNNKEKHYIATKICRQNNQEWYLNRICLDLKNVENYTQAKQDDFIGWHLHHRLELHFDNSIRFFKKDLIKLNLYYHRPSNELIFLRTTDHVTKHNIARKIWNKEHE